MEYPLTECLITAEFSFLRMTQSVATLQKIMISTLYNQTISIQIKKQKKKNNKKQKKKQQKTKKTKKQTPKPNQTKQINKKLTIKDIYLLIYFWIFTKYFFFF